MIKFFRKFRINSIAEKKIGKYLLYAIGEIVLVILGILIALNVNKQSELRKTEAKIDAIFKNVLVELAENIKETNALAKFYQKKDTVFNLVLNDQLTEADYQRFEIEGLYNATTLYKEAVLNTDAYNNLVRNMDAIPNKYEHITPKLNELQGRLRSIVVDFNEFNKTMVTNNILERSQKYDWYARNVSSSENMEEIDYLLNSIWYKNKVTNFQTFGINNHLRHTIHYRDKAVELYQELATLLELSPVHESFKINEDLIEQFSGTWQLIDSSQSLPDYIKQAKFYIAFENEKYVSYNSLDTIPEKTGFVVLDYKKRNDKTTISAVDQTLVYQTAIMHKDTLTILANDNWTKMLRLRD